MSKPFRAIAWDSGMLEKLRDATAEAKRLRQTAFKVDLKRDMKDVEFETDTAEEIVARLLPDFNQPRRAYPENREGQEP